MAGKALQKQRRAEIERRGGPEFLREWILDGKSIKSPCCGDGLPRRNLA